MEETKSRLKIYHCQYFFCSVATEKMMAVAEEEHSTWKECSDLCPLCLSTNANVPEAPTLSVPNCVLTLPPLGPQRVHLQVSMLPPVNRHFTQIFHGYGLQTQPASRGLWELGRFLIAESSRSGDIWLLYGWVVSKFGQLPSRYGWPKINCLGSDERCPTNCQISL